MKLIYIAGPFRHPSQFTAGQDCFAVQENIMRAMRLGLAVARTGTAFPVIPHANTMFMNGSAPDEIWLQGDLELLRRSDAILFTDNWRQSQGAIAEFEFARMRGIPCLFSLDECYLWLRALLPAAVPESAH
jgi:hypothetical protein